ncbi:MAG TPA: carboxypeptidase-like regulatory domain-containing protein, partial [Cyclobacteriaceae bacterium]
MHLNLRVHFVTLARAVTSAPLSVKVAAILLLACLQASATVTPQVTFLSKSSVTVDGFVEADQPEHSAAVSLSFQVSGTVREVNGEPLPGATVRLRGSDAGTVTDAMGRFVLEIPDGGGVLVVSYIGFLTEEVTVNEPNDALDIQLTPSVSEMQELVVIGYGTQKRSDLTGSISSINSEEIAKVPVTTMAQVLQGR